MEESSCRKGKQNINLWLEKNVEQVAARTSRVKCEAAKKYFESEVSETKMRDNLSTSKHQLKRNFKLKWHKKVETEIEVIGEETEMYFLIISHLYN